MSDLERAIDAVAEAPDGPAVGAFFDLDGTLVKGFTALAFLRETIQDLGGRALYDLASDVRKLRSEPDGDLKTIERAAQLFEGKTVEELEALSARVFKKRVAMTLRPGVRDLVRSHLRKGHTVVMATAATRFQATPVARDLDIPHLLPTEVEEVDGVLTGRVEGVPRWGIEKATAVKAFAADHGVELTESFAYGNGDEDQAFLEAVGHPAAVCPDRELAAWAVEASVPVLQLDDPKGPDFRSVMGTIAAFGMFNAGLFAAVAGKLVSGGRWKAIGPTLTGAADLALRSAGIELNVQGRENLEAARPAVFVVNHQSNLDPVVAGVLIRHDFTGVGKQEVASDPRAFGLSWLDIALIDRSDHETAKASVAALIDRIQAGESVAIWPEGTRMPTQRLGVFKKGAFHLAIDAGVPIVPIVLRNTGELMPRGSSILRPGIVDVCVLPPIPTADWSKDRLDEYVDFVHAQFERTLEDWPHPEA